MNFLDGHLYPENQQPLIITAAPADISCSHKGIGRSVLGADRTTTRVGAKRANCSFAGPT